MTLSFELFLLLQADGNPRVSTKILRFLEAIRETRSMVKSARACGFTVRHGWTLVRNVEKTLGQQLVTGDRGTGSLLTPYAVRLLQAEQRFSQSVQPVLAAAMAEFEAALQENERHFGE